MAHAPRPNGRTRRGAACRTAAYPATNSRAETVASRAEKAASGRRNRRVHVGGALCRGWRRARRRVVARWHYPRANVSGFTWGVRVSRVRMPTCTREDPVVIGGEFDECRGSKTSYRSVWKQKCAQQKKQISCFSLKFCDW